MNVYRTFKLPNNGANMNSMPQMAIGRYSSMASVVERRFRRKLQFGDCSVWYIFSPDYQTGIVLVWVLNVHGGARHFP